MKGYRLTEYLDETVTKYGDRIAVTDTDSSVSYSQLRNRALVIADAIASKGIVNEPVLIYMPKNVNAICSLWGILYSGNHYTYMDEDNGDDRLIQIAEKLNSRLVLTDPEHTDRCGELFKNADVIDVSLLSYNGSSGDSSDPSLPMRYGSDPAYINFTSGTTGVPKGVVVSHQSVIDFISVLVQTVGITEDDVIGNQAPLDFDVSVKDIYSCAFTGATLTLIPRDYFVKPQQITDYMDDKKITVIIWAVSAMCFLTTLKAFKYKRPEFLRLIMFSGEVMPYNHLKKWMNEYPDATFVNLYGPTEITCNCTYHILDDSRDYSEVLPIGIPFENEKVLLLDDDDKLVDKPDTQGEICISGITLASGYYADSENTKKAFMQNPVNKKYTEVIYRTGDYGYYNDRSELCYVGRRDNQIKLFGHRIELGEIEHRAGSVDGVTRVCILFNDKKLLLIYTGDIAEEDMREKIKGVMPEYMLPNKVIKIDELPVNKNGKIDRKKLTEIYCND